MHTLRHNSHEAIDPDHRANRELGYAAVKQLGSTGKVRLLIGAQTHEKAEKAIKKLGSSSDGLTPVTLDLDSDGSIKAIATYIREQFGSLDIFVNNGGINRSSDSNATLHETYRAVFETNVFGVAVVIDAFLPLLRASKYPDRRIVNVTSGLGRIGIAYSPTSE